MKIAPRITAPPKVDDAVGDIAAKGAAGQGVAGQGVAGSQALLEVPGQVATPTTPDAFMTLGRAAPAGLVSNPSQILSRLFDFVAGAKPVPMAKMPGVVMSAEPKVELSADERYAQKGAELAKEFPSLAFYVQDMRGFVNQKRAEFQEVKKVHPSDPHDHLEFFEAAKPFIEDAIPTLGAIACGFGLCGRFVLLSNKICKSLF